MNKQDYKDAANMRYIVVCFDKRMSLESSISIFQLFDEVRNHILDLEEWDAEYVAVGAFHCHDIFPPSLPDDYIHRKAGVVNCSIEAIKKLSAWKKHFQNGVQGKIF